MNAYILCGGKGTRVSEVTRKYDCEKHEIPINGRPFIEYMEEWLTDQNISNMTYVDTPDVGTGGAIRSIPDLVDSSDIRSILDYTNPYLLLYGDCYSPIRLWNMYLHHIRNRADMTMAVRMTTEKDYGRISANMSASVRHRIVDYRREHSEASYYTNIGTYIVDRRAMNFICDYPMREPMSLEKDIFEDSSFLDVMTVVAYDTTDLMYYDVGTNDRIDITRNLLGVK